MEDEMVHIYRPGDNMVTGPTCTLVRSLFLTNLPPLDTWNRLLM